MCLNALYQFHLKRLFDLVVALILFCIFSPIFLIVAFLIKISSSGPILYLGKRIGRGGKPFYMLKFRTMVRNAELIGGTSTSELDIRITGVGHFLRKYKLDELPQLLNVIWGQMSLVGPRPEVEEYTSLYTDLERNIILSVRPGITDHSSVKFRNLNTILSGATDPDLYYKDVIRPQKNLLRIKYVREFSFLNDLKILARTLVSLFK